MKKLFFLLPFIFSCSNHTPQRSISSERPLYQIFQRLEIDLAASAKQEVTLASCAALSKSYFYEIYELKAEDNLAGISSEEVTDLINKSYALRQNIRSQLKALVPGQDGTMACLEGIRNLTRALRYVEDYLIELYAKNDLNPDNYTTLQGAKPYFQTKSVTNIYDLQSGDIILSRGSAFTSAAIARLGSVDAQFSHLSVVYKDEEGKLWTIEAHIELGSLVNPISLHVAEKNSRSAVFRFQDQKIAHTAAKFIFERVKKQQETGKTVSYDFTMNYLDNKKLFCSEVAYQGFMDSSKVDVPLFKTTFNKGLIPFLNNLGVEVDSGNIQNFKTFMPGDLEFDSRFELIAEWRNPAKMKASRMRDALLTKIFEWMEKKDYAFHPSAKINTTSYAAWTLRRIPFIKKSFIEKFSMDMTTKQLQLFMTLDKVGDILEMELQKAQATKEYPMTIKEMFLELDKIRSDDFIRFQNHEKTLFHKYLRPTKY
jgi:hypothetical protein